MFNLAKGTHLHDHFIQLSILFSEDCSYIIPNGVFIPENLGEQRHAQMEHLCEFNSTPGLSH